jgi:hypothetical protein
MKKEEDNISFEYLLNLLKVHKYLFLFSFCLLFIILLSLNHHIFKKNFRGSNTIYIKVLDSHFAQIPVSDFLDNINNYITSGLFLKKINQDDTLPEFKIETQVWNVKNSTKIIKISVKHNFVSQEDFEKIKKILLLNFNNFLDSEYKNYLTRYEDKCITLNENFIKIFSSYPIMNDIKNIYKSIFLNNTINYDGEFVQNYIGQLNFLASTNSKNDVINNNINSKIRMIEECLNDFKIIKDSNYRNILSITSSDLDDVESLNLDLISIIIFSFLFNFILFFAYFFLYKKKI